MPKLSPINSLLNSKAGKFLTNPYAPAGAAAIATVSNLTKDIVNCYYYVHQSRHNERIPEDKRQFVAGLDLANGILNVVVQTGASVLLNKYIGKVFDKKIAAKHFTIDKYKQMYAAMENKVPFEKLVSNMEKLKGSAKIGLSVISTLVAMQVVAKRIIVPLIATPLATVFKNKFEQSNGKKPKTDEVKQDTTVQNKPEDKQEVKPVQAQTIKILPHKGNVPECFKKFVNNHDNANIK